MTVLEDFIEKHLYKSWCWHSLSSNPQITPQFIEKHIDRNWNWNEVSFNENITRQFVETYHYKDWHFDWLNVNGVLGESDTLIDFDIWNGDRKCNCRNVGDHYDRCETNFTHLVNRNFGLWGFSSNKNVTLDFIEANIDRNWYWGLHGLSSNPNLTTEFVEKYIDKEWAWGSLGLSIGLNINESFIEKYKDKLHWGPGGINHNKYLTEELIELYFDRIDFNNISNPNITTYFIEKYIDKNWHWGFISTLTFDHTQEKFKKFKLENKAARVIQNACHNWLFAPICKDHTIGINPRLSIAFLEKAYPKLLFSETNKV
jgi:hypothetical protein